MLTREAKTTGNTMSTATNTSTAICDTIVATKGIIVCIIYNLTLDHVDTLEEKIFQVLIKVKSQ